MLMTKEERRSSSEPTRRPRSQQRHNLNNVSATYGACDYKRGVDSGKLKDWVSRGPIHGS